MPGQIGSTRNIIRIIVALLIVVGLGAVVWGYANYKPVDGDSSNSSSDNSSSSNLQASEMGEVTGSLVYPSEDIPDELEVHATNIDTNEDYVVTSQILNDEFERGVGYRMSVPAGRYYIYGVLNSEPDEKAYYSEFVKCGMGEECEDHDRVEVTVRAGEVTDGITVGDWSKQ